jgi:tetratricopeptide (TPR) repeat protein
MEGLSATEPLHVVYESEPQGHGAAAAALPELPAGFLRGLLRELLTTAEDVDGLAIDYFPAVSQRFAAGMERGQREDLLLQHAPPHALYRALREEFGARVAEPPRLGATAAGPNPYRGLLVFGVRDAPLFFGRRGKTAELRKMLFAATQPAGEANAAGARLVAVVGYSGSGKSSLVQAGLLADLARNPAPQAAYVAAVMRPQGEPLRALSKVLLRLFSPELSSSLARFSEEVSAVARKLGEGGRALRDFLGLALRDERQRLLLVVDQLEELYTDESEAGKGERRAFVETLLDAASAASGRLDVVVTLRSDALERTAEDPALHQAVTASGRALLLGSLDRAELAEAVREPAVLAGRPLPADAVALLLGEAEGQPGALPLLQFAMQKLWAAQDAAPERPVAELLQELGGVGGALAKEAEALYLGLNPATGSTVPANASPPPNAAQLRIRRACVRLLHYRQGQIIGRLRPTLRELVGEGETLADVRATLARFIEGRLLVIGGDGEDARVEIGHEWLARHWPRLAQWLNEAEQHLPLLLRLSEAAQSWQRQRRAGWLLWRGDDLAELRRALPALQASGSLGGDERAFATACIAGQRQRQVAAVAGLLGLITITIGVGALAYYAKQQAQAARAQTEVARQRLRQAVSVADRVVFEIDRQLAGVPGTAEIRKTVLGGAMGMLDELRKEADAGSDLGLLRTRMAGHLQRGSLALTHDNLTLARAEYQSGLVLAEDLLRRQPTDAQAQRDLSVSLEKMGEVAGKMGQLGEAKSFFERSGKIRESLVAAHPQDAQAQRDLSISLNKLGEVAGQMGQLGEAKAFFERGLKISESLAAADPQDAQAQRDLSISLEKLGGVAGKMGQLGEAKAFFERDLKISEALAAADPQDAQAQRDLSISLERLGEVARQMGQLGEAKAFFERGLKIRESLAAADPKDAQAQRDLSYSIERLGEVAGKMGQLSEAKSWFERSLQIRETLAVADKNDAQAQRDLSISLERLGEVAGKMGQLGEAKAFFERGLKISESLAAGDPQDAQAQRNLSISLNKLGEVAGKMGQLGEAKAFFERGLKIFESLAAADPQDAQAQRDLSISLEKLGEVAGQMGQLGEAKAFFERGLKIRESLAAADPQDAQAQRDLSISLEKLGNVAGKMGQLGKAKVLFERGLRISESLAAADPQDAQAQRDLSVSLGRVADIARKENRLADAESLLRRSLTADEQLLRINPLALDTQSDLVIDHMQLSALLHQRGQRSAAQQEAKAAAALLDTLRERLPKQDAEGLDGAIRSLLR